MLPFHSGERRADGNFHDDFAVFVGRINSALFIIDEPLLVIVPPTAFVPTCLVAAQNELEMIHAVRRVFHCVGSERKRQLVYRFARQDDGAERPRPFGGTVPRKLYFPVFHAAQVITRPCLGGPARRRVGALLVHELASFGLRLGEPRVFDVNVAVRSRHARIGKQANVVHNVEDLPVKNGYVKGIGYELFA